MISIWVVLFVALTGLHCGYGLPVRPTPQDYPHDGRTVYEGWGAEGGLYAAIPALALVITAIVLIFGCTWCYRHKDCKPNEGTDNQIFTASAQHLHAAQRIHPPDSGFSEPANNNISEDNNNGPISLREMQNIANNNATAYIVSENEERNRISRESVVEFEPLPTGFIGADPLEHCADWFGGEDFPRNNLQYLREIGRGWFGRVVEGEIEEAGANTTVAVKILNQNATLEEKARFLDESKMYRDIQHEHILAFIGKCLQEDPWILIFELCTMDLQQYLIANRPKMAILNESGVPLRLMCDVTSALSYLHSRGYIYGALCAAAVSVRGDSDRARATLGRYAVREARPECVAPELQPRPAPHTTSSEVWSLGTLTWEVCSWGDAPTGIPTPPPELPCPYKNHLCQVMQLCWNADPSARPTAAQVHALINHLYVTHTQARSHAAGSSHTELFTNNTDFEERWQRLKPNTIPKIDEHVAIIHAPSTSMTSHFTGSDQEFDNNTLSVDMDTAVSRSSSIMSDRDPLSVQIKSESLTNLHGSLEDVRNIYLTHNETAALECHQGNIHLEDNRERDLDRSDASMDPWLKDIIAGSQDDVSYYKDVSDVIKNLDNILNSEKTSSSESSHQASPSRDNLSLDCKKEYPMQSSLVKSPGIINFQNVLDAGFGSNQDGDPSVDDEVDRDTIGTLSHSFERHSDSTSQHTLENLTPDTPMKDIEVFVDIENEMNHVEETHVESKLKLEIAECENQTNNTDVENRDNSTEISEIKSSVKPAVSEVEPTAISEMKNSIKPAVIVEDESQIKHSNGTRLETLLEQTDIAEVEKQIDAIIDVATNIVLEKDKSVVQDIELPNEVIDSTIPKLKELCLASMPSVSESNDEQLLLKKDCQTPCDNVTEIRTDIEETKSIDDVREIIAEIIPCEKIETTKFVQNYEQIETSVQEIILPVSADEITNSNEGLDTLPSVTDDVSNSTQENDTLHIKLEDIGPESIESEHNYSKDETILVSDLVDTTTDSSKSEPLKMHHNVVEVDVKVDLEPVTPEQTPVSVQNIIDVMKEPADFRQIEEADFKIVKQEIEKTPTHLPPDTVQITNKVTPVQESEILVYKKVAEAKNENIDSKDSETNNMPRSDSFVVDIKEQSNDSTVYMDLINNTNSQILRNSTVDNSIKDLEVNSCLETAYVVNDSTLSKNDSTAYLDLPSFDAMKKTDEFLHNMEKMMSRNKHVDENLISSTPIASDNSVDTLDKTVENLKRDETIVISETKGLDPGMSTTKMEQKCAPDSMSPFESPSHKSHHTDTYDENSSVVLGPFDNSTLDNVKAPKTSIEPVELPREELLAFSSNFSEINLETPSPLRDRNFLNEVPDIIPDDMQFDDLTSISEPKVDPAEGTSDDTEGSGSGTQKRVSPSTPPNSPGVFLASTSQQKYLVDIDLNNECVNLPEPESSSLQSIDLNQIELQITSKMAMAENENNLNIEYSGPLTVEGLIEEGGGMRESDAIPESYLAGNGGSIEDVREELSLDEECVKALRNELELKLPLAQVAAIEPQCEGDGEWQGDLPPPPEQLVVTYSGALSPIQEETGQQLSAYDNDNNWNPSTRTESSESYPEPCNNSTDSATELPCRDNTYTVPSREHTYTLQRTDAITMSADSLNASPHKSHREPDEILSPIDDRTYAKDEERESTCEHISQVSPFLVSPTTDTSDTADNGTRVSTLSRTTLPTDAKLSKPSDTQCLSKATSIDSWCSNDTLYNVEENFDDLAMDPDVLIECEPKDEGNSESTDTLTHNDEDKEHSHCSTYIIHDSRSEPCETFAPDSITANDNYTYTKEKAEAVGATPSGDTELNDSTKNTQTKDLAYGTLMSGMPSFSNCTTEHASGLEDPWRLPQPELVRRSPVGDGIELSPPQQLEHKECAENASPRLEIEPSIRKIDSIEISCLQDDMNESRNRSEAEKGDIVVTMNDSPRYNYRNMVPSQTSTPLVELSADTEDTVAIPMNLPQINAGSSEYNVNIPSFQSFQQSAECRPQDLLSNATNESTSNRESFLLEGETKTLSRNSNRDSLIISEPTNSYSDFENSAVCKPQNTKSSQSIESGISSEEFRQFENSIKTRPQDLSSLIDASSMLLKSERNSSELMMSSLTEFQNQATDSNGRNNEPVQSLDINPPSITNLIESHELVDTREPPNSFLINFHMEDETEQPHSIIVTEVPMNASKGSSNRTYDSHASGTLDFNQTYNSHESKRKLLEERQLNVLQSGTNGDMYSEQPESLIMIEAKSPTVEDKTLTNHSLTMEDEVKNFAPKEVNNVSKPLTESGKEFSNGLIDLETVAVPNAATEENILVNGGSEKYATVNFLNETFEELIESSVDDSDRLIIDEELPTRDSTTELESESNEQVASPVTYKSLETSKEIPRTSENSQEGHASAIGVPENVAQMTAVTENFLQNEQKYATLDSYFPLLSDIRFTGPASEMMSTSFQDSPTSPTSPECEQDSKPTSAEQRTELKDWDSDSDSHSSNSSSGEFIWKDGDGHETSVVPSTHFDHQRGSSGGPPPGGAEGRGESGDGSADSGDSGSGSEGDEVEFVPSSWDCRAAPSKSSLRSLEQVAPESKKRVVFKRQKYHCVYEYPREAPTPQHSPAYLPDLSTYAEWDPSSAEEAELCYGQLFAAAGTGPLAAAAAYPLRAGIAFGADYDEDFFISSSARPFESLGLMSTSSQFFPGLHAKRSLLDDVTDDFPPPPSPLSLPLPATPTALLHTHAPSLDFTTPDSGVEDITPGSTVDEEISRQPPSPEGVWRADSATSSESASPSSPGGGGGGGALGGLRHTRDKLKLDLPPSPHVPSPRHNRVFNFILEKPKRRSEAPPTPLVMTDDTPLLPATLSLHEHEDLPLPEPTFSTFGKSVHKTEPEQKIVLDEVETTEVKEDPPKVVEAVKGEGTVLDSGDEDSGIESSSKATLERKASNVS